MKMFVIMEHETVCANCTHYCQHYLLLEGESIACNQGHCMYPGLKNRPPGNKGCNDFTQKGG